MWDLARPKVSDLRIDFISLNLSFSTFKMGLIKVPVLQSIVL